MNWAKHITLFSFLCIASITATSQIQPVNELGLPFIRNYSHKETGGHSQNWDVVQDNRGVMYFANTDGILEYDGVSWRHIKNPTGLVFSLAIDENNVIYAGTRDDIGYLSPDSTGTLNFVSLRDQVDPRYKNFGGVRRTFSTVDGIYFVGSRHILRWSEEKMKVWESGEASFHISSYLNDQLFVRQPGIGLMTLSNNTLELVPGGEFFADKRVYFMLPQHRNDESKAILIGTANDGLFVYNEGRVEPFSTKADQHLKKNWIYHGAYLPDGSLAISTIHGGLVVIDEDGEVKYYLDRKTGLQNESIHKGLVDNQGSLWLALDNGISRVDVSSALTNFPEALGVKGIIKSIKRHQNRLFIATNTGVGVLQQGNEQSLPTFRPIEGLLENCWSLLSYGDDLLVSTSTGIFQISNGQAIRIQGEGFDGRKLYSSKNNSSIVYAGSTNGLYALERNGEKWAVKGKMENVDSEIHYILEEDSTMWLGTFHKGIYEIQMAPNSILKTRSITLYDTIHGLPSMVENIVTPYKGDKIFPTHHGIYKFNKVKKQFELDHRFGEIFSNGSKSIFHFEEGNGRAWMHMWDRDDITRNTGFIEPQPDGSYSWNNLAFVGQNRTSIYVILSEMEGITWFGSSDLLLRYDQKDERDYNYNFRSVIRKVSLDGDSLIFGGYGKSLNPQLYYSSNAVRFEFTATSYDHQERNEFQYWLEGFDNTWSEWTNETQKDYTNLPEGNYNFKIRAKNAYQTIGEEDVYGFTILPPWYRTWWAYTLYTFLALSFMQLIIYWRSLQLKKDKVVLEKTVAERTQEIEIKNIQLSEQAEKLKEMDTIKSNFFANISHEFRTPLTLILGPLREHTSDQDALIPKKQHNMMRSNADRLLRLINQLLDLSKLESGALKLQVAERNIVPFVKGVTMSFETLAINEGIDLNVVTEEDQLLLYFDDEKLEKVLSNLLSNAFKFSSRGGSITVEIKTYEDKVDLVINDSGIGIPQNQVAHIFDRFYQVDSSQTKLQEGTGIGLALTKELVELHHGAISVQSEEGEGTQFIIKLWKGTEHFNPGEIVENPESGPEKQDNVANLGPVRPDIKKPEEIGVEDIDQLLILVVEDNHDVREYIKGHLVAEYSILEATDGDEGLSLAREHIPDLIISDVMMPIMDGFELTSKLKADIKTSHIPVILLTAKADGEAKIEGLETGADDYLTKPFDGKELLTRIRNLIKVRHTLWERISRELTMQPKRVKAPSMEEQFLGQIMEHIEIHLADPEFSVEKLSELMAMSRIHLHRKLKSLTDQSASQLIRVIRLKRARQLLEQNSATVTEIAYQVGFNNISYFSKCFKEQFGVLPSEFEEEG